jgi:hypothetical protein
MYHVKKTANSLYDTRKEYMPLSGCFSDSYIKFNKPLHGVMQRLEE